MELKKERNSGSKMPKSSGDASKKPWYKRWYGVAGMFVVLVAVVAALMSSGGMFRGFSQVEQVTNVSLNEMQLGSNEMPVATIDANSPNQSLAPKLEVFEKSQVYKAICFPGQVSLDSFGRVVNCSGIQAENKLISVRGSNNLAEFKLSAKRGVKSVGIQLLKMNTNNALDLVGYYAHNVVSKDINGNLPSELSLLVRPESVMSQNGTYRFRVSFMDSDSAVYPFSDREYFQFTVQNISEPNQQASIPGVDQQAVRCAYPADTAATTTSCPQDGTVVVQSLMGAQTVTAFPYTYRLQAVVTAGSGVKSVTTKLVGQANQDKVRTFNATTQGESRF